MTLIDILWPLTVVIAFAAGLNYAIWRIRRKPDGVFLVNFSNPEDDMFKMRIDVPIEAIPEAKYLIFKIEKTGK